MSSSPRAAHQDASAATSRGSGGLRSARPARTARRRPPATTRSGAPGADGRPPQRARCGRASASGGGEAEPDARGAPRRSARPGVPTATSRPRSSTATRSARRSTSPSSWVVRRIVVPAARSAAIRSRVACFARRVHAGGRLVEDEELRPADERQREAQPLLLAARQPPVAASRPRCRGRRARAAGPGPPGRGRTGRTGGGPRAAVVRWSMPPSWSISPIRGRSARPSLHGIQAEHPAPSRRRRGGSPRGSRPSSSCRRRSGPSSANSSPRADLERDAVEDLAPAVGLADAVDAIATSSRPACAARPAARARPSRLDLRVLRVEVLRPRPRRSGSPRRTPSASMK